MEILRSPRLDTVLMVEKFIKEHSGEYTLYQLWKILPKKVMYQTFKVIIAYLLEMNRIGLSKENILVYTWSPSFKSNPDLRWE